MQSDVRILSAEETTSEALWRLVFYTILMVTVPIGSYFTSKSFLFEGLLSMTSSHSYFYAAIVAILMVHVILAMFIYVAWKEGTRPVAKKRE